MRNRESLVKLVKEAARFEGGLAASLTEEEKAAAGTLERWEAKDLLAHIAAWNSRLSANLQALSRGEAPGEEGELDVENERTFAEFQDRSWKQITAMAAQARNDLVEQVSLLDEHNLEEREFFPGDTGVPLWRRIAATGYRHPMMHLAEFARARKDDPLAAEINEAMAQGLGSLDSSDSWQGVVKYNLACHYSLSGQTEKAIEVLRDALALEPELVEWSKQDADFAPIRDKEGYLAIYVD